MGCGRLSRLPVEIRMAIYGLILSFQRPISRRHIVAGSENTNILRTSRQIHEEAMDALYDCNVMYATRNDFCKNINTSFELRRPMNEDRIRHLHLFTLSNSIACHFPDNQCEVCSDTGTGLIATLRGMPHLQTVTIDHSTQRFRTLTAGWTMGTGLNCIDVGRYKIRKSRPDRNDFIFEHRPLAAIWPELIRMSALLLDKAEEADRITALRRHDNADILEALWLLIWAHARGRLCELQAATFDDLWVVLDDVDTMTPARRSVVLHEFTVAVQEFLAQMPSAEARLRLTTMRNMS